MQARFRGGKLYRKSAALARRNACQASVPLGQNAVAGAGYLRPHHDRARKPDVGDGQRQHFGVAGGDWPEIECPAADSAKHTEAGNGTPEFDGGTSAIGRYCECVVMRSDRHGRILDDQGAASSRRHAGRAGAVRDLIAGAADRWRDGQRSSTDVGDEQREGFRGAEIDRAKRQFAGRELRDRKSRPVRCRNSKA